MKSTITIASALSLGAGAALAGGLDRSGQPIDVLFKDGNVAQISFGSVTPSVSGEAVGLFLTGESGNMAPAYTSFAAAVKGDIGEKLSLALIADQPYGANVDYSDASGGYFATGSMAEVGSQAITALVNYDLGGGFSVHAGVRQQTVNAEVTLPAIGGYNVVSEDSSATGFLAGFAYERPEIALRVAVTVNGSVDHDMTITETCVIPAVYTCAGTPYTTSITTPQSVNVAFQTGIAADTLLFGNIRYAKWTQFAFAPDDYAALNDGDALQDYDEDTVAASLGVGRRFNDQWSGAITLGYEPPQGGFAGNLSPSDGLTSIGIGATYNAGGVRVTGGVRFVQVGDADVEHPGIEDATGAEFRDNTALAYGIQVEIPLN